MALIDAGHFKQAWALAESRLKANPKDADALYAMARYKLQADDLDSALSLVERSLALDPANADATYLMAGIYGRKAERASVFSQFGLARRFKKEAEAVLAMDPRHIEARLGLIEFHMKAPGVVGADKRKAQTLADEIMKINASRGYLALAVLARIEKQTDPLEGFYKKAVEADPNSYPALMSLVNFYEQQKQYDVAERYAREALKASPDRAGGYSFLASLAAFQERWRDLDTTIAQSEKAVPDNLSLYYRVGNVLLSSGKDLPRAERYFRKYLTQEPEPGAPMHAHAYWRLGLVLEKQGRKAEAVAALETAVRMKPDLDQARKDLKRLK
ncbi:MAG: tetratricopeptide repeat protein [Acidobacteriota bacterium]